MKYLEMAQAVTGESGWIESAQGLADKTREECRMQQMELNRHPLVLLANSQIQGFKAQALEQEELVGKTVDVVYIRQDDKSGFKVYLDPESGHLVGQRYSGKRGNEWGEFLRLYSEPVEIGGIIYPSVSETYFNDQLYIAATVSALFINPPANPQIYVRPAGSTDDQ
jgi:hypothetical protein